MKRSATSSGVLPVPLNVGKGTRKAEGERERQGTRLHPPPLSQVSGSRPHSTPSPLARLRSATPGRRAPAASAPTSSRRTSPGAAVAKARLARASPGAIGYRFSCLSLGAPGERGLHRPAGAPASISLLSPHRRRSPGATKPRWAGGRRRGDHLQRQPRGGGCGQGLPPTSLPGSSTRHPLPHKLRIQVQASAFSPAEPSTLPKP